MGGREVAVTLKTVTAAGPMVCFATQHDPTVQFAHFCVYCVGLDSDCTIVRTEYNSVKIIAYVGTVNYLMQLPPYSSCALDNE